MPSQVIQLPAPTLAAILDHGVLGRSHAIGIHDLDAKAMTAADGARALRVHLQPLVHCPDLRDHLVDDVYALLLTSEPLGSAPLSVAPPRPLSAGLALHVLHETEAALQDLTELTGHDRLAVSHAFAQAGTASPAVRAPRRRRPANAYETGLLAEAQRVQDVIAPAMARLDRKLASYQASLQVCGCGSIQWAACLCRGSSGPPAGAGCKDFCAPRTTSSRVSSRWRRRSMMPLSRTRTG